MPEYKLDKYEIVKYKSRADNNIFSGGFGRFFCVIA